jgi:hypothetical protein
LDRRNGRKADEIEEPSRPRRETEREYMAALAQACTLADWQEIVGRAVTDAKAGDPKARQWLASYLVGAPKTEARSLFSLVVDEEAGIDAVGSAAKSAQKMEELTNLINY